MRFAVGLFYGLRAILLSKIGVVDGELMCSMVSLQALVLAKAHLAFVNAT